MIVCTNSENDKAFISFSLLRLRRPVAAASSEMDWRRDAVSEGGEHEGEGEGDGEGKGEFACDVSGEGEV